MSGLELVAVIMVTLIVLIPVAGLTARFVLGMRQTQGEAGEHLALLEQRMALMEQQQANTESDVDRLLEVQEFQEKLLTSQEEGS